MSYDKYRSVDHCTINGLLHVVFTLCIQSTGCLKGNQTTVIYRTKFTRKDKRSIEWSFRLIWKLSCLHQHSSHFLEITLSKTVTIKPMVWSNIINISGLREYLDIPLPDTLLTVVTLPSVFFYKTAQCNILSNFSPPTLHSTPQQLHSFYHLAHPAPLTPGFLPHCPLLPTHKKEIYRHRLTQLTARLNNSLPQLYPPLTKWL